MLQCRQSVLQCRPTQKNWTSILLLLLIYQAEFTERFTSTACAYSLTSWFQCPSRALICHTTSVEGLPMGTVARDGNCKIYPLNFQWTIHSGVIKYGRCTRKQCNDRRRFFVSNVTSMVGVCERKFPPKHLNDALVRVILLRVTDIQEFRNSSSCTDDSWSLRQQRCWRKFLDEHSFSLSPSWDQTRRQVMAGCAVSKIVNVVSVKPTRVTHVLMSAVSTRGYQT
jgi:hypothetical protein